MPDLSYHATFERALQGEPRTHYHVEFVSSLSQTRARTPRMETQAQALDYLSASADVGPGRSLEVVACERDCPK